VQHHNLIWPKTDRLIGASFPITKLDFKRSATRKNFHDRAYLPAPELVFGKINRERNYVKEFDWGHH
jgi:hypothetical protein